MGRSRGTERQLNAAVRSKVDADEVAISWIIGILSRSRIAKWVRNPLRQCLLFQGWLCSLRVTVSASKVGRASERTCDLKSCDTNSSTSDF